MTTAVLDLYHNPCSKLLENGEIVPTLYRILGVRNLHWTKEEWPKKTFPRPGSKNKILTPKFN